jgi:glycerol-3-phosphate dehydrogenase
MYDIAVIGAGIVGCSIARALSKYELKTVLIEKEADVADCTTKANSAIVHAGYDAKPGSLKAKLNVLGNPVFDELCRILDVPFKRTGSLVVAFEDDEIPSIYKLFDQGIKNGVPGMEILQQSELRRIEPNISVNVQAALYAPTCGIIGPWELAVAMAENAADNGVEIFLNTKVENIMKKEDRFILSANGIKISAKYVINCAGLHADEINNMVAAPSFQIMPRRGEYNIMDKNVGGLVNKVIFQCPSRLGKGVLVSPTVHGNLLIGPNSEDINEKDNFETTKGGLKYILETSSRSVKSMPASSVITAFTGLRARCERDDFIIEEASDAKGFINVAGIESPGLTAAPAIADYVEDILRDIGLQLVNKPDFIEARRPMVRFNELTYDGKQKIIQQDSRYGKIICRCETITEGEIVDAIHRNVGARTIDGVKRRVRPGSGRCQGGFCSPRVMEILARELGIDITKVVKDHPKSYILTAQTKESNQGDGSIGCFIANRTVPLDSLLAGGRVTYASRI